MATCPNGHNSEWDDYCNTCGAPIAGPAGQIAPSLATDFDAAAKPSAPPPSVVSANTGESCPACGEPCEVAAPFCEACGHDFAAPITASTSAEHLDANAAAVADASTTVAVINISEEYFDGHSAGNGMRLPSPIPPELLVPLTRDIMLIGRRSQSRGIFPDIDLSDEYDDPAVSHRHAELRRTPDGWALVDLGSTNGTRLSPSGPTIAPGVAVAVDADETIYAGAWTAIRLRKR